MSWKEKCISHLLTVYDTIEWATNQSDICSKTIHRVGLEDVFVCFDTTSLAVATQKLLENKGIEDNYSQQALAQLLADKLISAFSQKPEDIRAWLGKLVSELSNASPETMNVYMGIQGVSLAKRMKIGAFVFIPSKDYDSLGIKSIHFKMESHIKEQIWQGHNHVMVSVTACDPGKAQEKAYAEFQWIENAVRLFVAPERFEVGITSFHYAFVENSLVTTDDGAMRGTSSKFIGAHELLSLDSAFALGGILYRVIDKLGRKQTDLTEFQKRIRHAVYLGGLSVHETVPEIAYFLCVSAFETLFQKEIDKYVNSSIAQQILEAFCFLIADECKRRETFEQMRSLYGKRSAVAHGGKTEVSKQEVELVRNYLRVAVIKLVNDPILSKLKTIDDVSALILKKKFGDNATITQNEKRQNV
jgi:hypothetical protein